MERSNLGLVEVSPGIFKEELRKAKKTLVEVRTGHLLNTNLARAVSKEIYYKCLGEKAQILGTIKDGVSNLYYSVNTCRLHWPPGLRHELSSPAQTLGSWVRSPLKTWTSVCVYSVLVLSCVCR
jgi:hypothetical protein